MPTPYTHQIRTTGLAGSSLSDRIRHLLAQAIAAGDYPPGSQLPTERELAARYDVSLAPVRIALGELAAAGLIERTQGRGTFVRHTPVTVELSFRPNISGTMERLGLDYKVLVLEIAQVDGPKDILARLKFDKRTKLIQILRYLTIEGAIVAVLRAWMPARRFSGLLKDEALAGGASLYGRLEALFGVVPRNIEATLAVAHADHLVSDIMGVPFGTPTMEVSTVAVDQHGEVVEFGLVNYDARRFVFNLRTP